MNQRKDEIEYLSVTLTTGRKITYSQKIDKVASWGVTDTGNLFITNERESVIVVFNTMAWEMFEVKPYAS